MFGIRLNQDQCNYGDDNDDNYRYYNYTNGCSRCEESQLWLACTSPTVILTCTKKNSQAVLIYSLL